MTDLPFAASDADLAIRMASGDETAFAAVYDRHVDVVYGSVVRFLHDREAAEEVVQDAYVAVWRHAEQYVPSAGSLLGWLLRIARNKAIDRIRATTRRPRLVVLGGLDDDQEGELDRALASGRGVGNANEGPVGPEAETTLAWTRAVVRTALSAMPVPERQVLELAYDAGLTQVEIAERLDWPLGTVKTRTRRGLAALRAVLEDVPHLIDADDSAGTRTAGHAGPSARMGGPFGPR